MKHSKQIKPTELPIAAISALTPITNALASALLYSHDPTEDAPATKPENAPQYAAWEQYVRDQLRVRFLDELYVTRPEVEKLQSLIRMQRLVVVSGPRGSGKTTTMLKVSHDFKQNDWVSLHYINLRDHAARFTASATTKKTVCQIIYTVLFECFVANASETTKQEWRVFLVQNEGELFQPLHHTIVLDAQVSRSSPTAQWIELLDGSKHREAWDRAWSQFNDGGGDSKLTLLLKFLSEVKSHHCIVMIDNVDRYNLKMQRDVIDKLIDLSNVKPPIITPVIAVRSGNFQRLDLEGRADNQFFVLKLRPIHSNPYADELVAKMIRKRLDFVARLDFDSHLNPVALTQLAQNLKYPSRQAFLLRHAEILKLIQQRLGDQEDLLETYLAWHNGSMRSAASHIFNLLHAFVTDTDPYFRYSTVARRSAGKEAEELLSDRGLRTCAFRHLVFSSRRPPQEPNTVNLFDESQRRPTHRIRFPALRLLEYLGAQPDHSSTWGRMKEDLGLLGIEPNEIFAHLVGLTNPRGFEADGFVLLDVREGDRTPNMPDGTEIELLQSGLVHCDKVSISCEHLFWMALFTDVKDRLIPPAVMVGEAEASDPNFTVQVAAAFLCGHIIPAYLEEHSYSGSRGGPSREDRRAFQLNYYTFGRSRSATRDFFPIRADRSLRSFARANDVSKDTWEVVERQLSQGAAKCRAIWERFGIPS